MRMLVVACLGVLLPGVALADMSCANLLARMKADNAAQVAPRPIPELVYDLRYSMARWHLEMTEFNANAVLEKTYFGCRRNPGMTLKLAVWGGAMLVSTGDEIARY